MSTNLAKPLFGRHRESNRLDHKHLRPTPAPRCKQSPYSRRSYVTLKSLEARQVRFYSQSGNIALECGQLALDARRPDNTGVASRRPLRIP